LSDEVTIGGAGGIRRGEPVAKTATREALRELHREGEKTENGRRKADPADYFGNAMAARSMKFHDWTHAETGRTC
jgi:hypothetical protein